MGSGLSVKVNAESRLPTKLLRKALFFDLEISLSSSLLFLIVEAGSLPSIQEAAVPGRSLYGNT
jgi:hypothetical protein